MFIFVILRQGITAFSLTDIQEIDSIISGYNVFENKEAGPLILTWAVFLCLISSLPQREEYNALLVIFFSKNVASSIYIHISVCVCTMIIISFLIK